LVCNSDAYSDIILNGQLTIIQFCPMLVSRFGANFPKYYLRAPKCREESLIKHVLGPANDIVPITKCFRLDCRFQDLNPEAWAGSTLGTTYYEETGTIRARLPATPIRMVMRGGSYCSLHRVADYSFPRAFCLKSGCATGIPSGCTFSLPNNLWVLHGYTLPVRLHLFQRQRCH
jgi:hypothetical protein